MLGSGGAIILLTAALAVQSVRLNDERSLREYREEELRTASKDRAHMTATVAACSKSRMAAEAEAKSMRDHWFACIEQRDRCEQVWRPCK